ncbi:MAG: hypothetical protein GY777_18240 [Candidatus Brocadiaceae bacterium]|nr:hypothetical protein [Candidatus Brocadiaceae bacterium]
MKVKPSSEWHEDRGSSIFLSYSKDFDGTILGEPPEICFASGYLQEDFDYEKWTHFIDGDYNFLFSDVDPIKFPLIVKDTNQ